MVVAAAGNSATDACNSSPAASDFALVTISVLSVCLTVLCYRTTVGAIDEFDTFAYFSNYGRCVEIQAPVSCLFHQSYSLSGYVSLTSTLLKLIHFKARTYLAQFKAS